MLRISIGAAGLLCLASAASAQSSQPQHWNDSLISRLEVLALLQGLNAALLSHDSATLVLEGWCDRHHIAAPAHIVAERDKAVHKEPTPAQLKRLGVTGGEQVRYRGVKLVCGDHVLSEADNWYVPGRLTADMNQALDTTDISFGRAVAPLHFQRHTLSADLLWSPLPEGWETAPTIASGGSEPLQIPDHVLRHHAILTRADGMPFSEVVETYSSNVLDFAPPVPR
jgi:chorismate-pyruvate lyase